MSKILMIIPPERFRDEELFVTKEELEKGDHSIVISGTREGIINGSRGGKAQSEVSIDKINTGDYDELFLSAAEALSYYFTIRMPFALLGK